MGVNASVLAGHSRKWGRLQWIAEHYPDSRIATCSRYVASRDGLITAYRKRRADGSMSVSFSGLNRCGVSMLCPNCASVHASRDADDLRACDQAARIKGLVRAMGTFTFAHVWGTPYGEVRTKFRKALSDVRHSRRFAELRREVGLWFGYDGEECTHGQHGWHPHAHVYMVCKRGTDLHWLAEEIRKLYDEALAKHGLYASRERGFQLDASDERIADYIAKYGREDRWDGAAEAASGARKGGRKGRTPMQLLDDAIAGDAEAARLFDEYYAYWYGSSRRHSSWAPGFYRAMLGYARGEEPQHVKDAMALTAALQRGEAVCTLNGDDWYALWRHRAVGIFAWLCTLWDAPRLRRYLNALRAHLLPRSEGLAA